MRAPKIQTSGAPAYIREWMKARGVDQKRLAERMGRAEGTISKKLKRPETIDLAWLQEFATALKVRPSALLEDPATTEPLPDNLPARFAELQSRASRSSDDQIAALIAVIDSHQTAAPPSEPSPALRVRRKASAATK